MKTENKAAREPLFHVVKRDNLKIKTKIGIYAAAIIGGLFLCGIICAIAGDGNPFSFFGSLIVGAFDSGDNVLYFLRTAFLLIGVSMALLPAFKMKFWNLGANGQILIGGLATIMCMHFMGGKVPDGVIILCMIVSSILAGAIWAVIPAICKAYFNTNESLFTLMMNYIAQGLVAAFVAYCVTDSSSGTIKNLTLPEQVYGNLPELGNEYTLTILVCALIFGLMFIYTRYSKKGYETAVVGDSQPTAKYIGINVKKVIIRTLIISGAICGIVGLLLTGNYPHSINEGTAENMGFTAIMTTWLADCNPLFIIAACCFVAFITNGMEQVCEDFGFLNDSVSNLIIGIIYFFIIACAFFIKYKVLFRKKSNGTKKSDNASTENAPAERVADAIAAKEAE